MEKERAVRIAILLSLLLHGVIILLLLLVKPGPANPFRSRKTVEVELVDPHKLLEAMKHRDNKTLGQIVDQSKKAINDEKPKDSKFLSRNNQTVVHETQAAMHGKFRNSDGTSGQPDIVKKIGQVQPKQPIAKRQDQPKEPRRRKTAHAQPKYMTSPRGLAVKTLPTLKDLTPSFKPEPPGEEQKPDDVAQGGGPGPSETDDHLKDVQTGMETLLSTREFVYYSYYNRIKEKLRQYWEPAIKVKMERILRQGRTIASDTERVTRIIITLDSNGVLIRVQVIGPSGVEDLDDAAVEAFRAAAPFPNPPKGIVESDGTIKIRWDFILEASNYNLDASQFEC